jgi:cytochrome b
MRIAEQAIEDGPPDDERAPTRLVWDLPLRITHWLLVITFAGAWATHYAGVQWFTWHRRLGYLTLVLVAFRVLWGFVGTRHARFSTFLRGPAGILAYLRCSGGDAPAGHNPLAALSVVAMLAALLVQAGTGLFANDEIANAGPFYGWIDPATSNRITGVHELVSNVLLVLVGLHLAAIAWHARVRRRPLVRAMFTGRKAAAQVASQEEIPSSRTALAFLIVVLLGVALAVAIRLAPDATIALF